MCACVFVCLLVYLFIYLFSFRFDARKSTREPFLLILIEIKMKKNILWIVCLYALRLAVLYLFFPFFIALLAAAASQQLWIALKNANLW